MATTNLWLDASEIVSGLVLTKRITPDAVNPQYLYPPYGDMIPILKKGGQLEDVIEACGYSAVIAAKQAVANVDGVIPAHTYLDRLEKMAIRFQGGSDLEKIAHDLQAGKPVDISKLMNIATAVDRNIGKLTPLSDVKAEKGTWVKTGFVPVDEFFGGVIKAGLTIIAAAPGVGKSSLALKLATSMAKKYKKKKVALFSLEMLLGQVVDRWLENDKSITKEEKSRIIANDEPLAVGEVYAVASKAASSEDLSMIIVDFADMLAQGEQSESIMGTIYHTLAVLAKRTKVPVLLVCQLNRSTYVGGVPKINHIRYSGMAEILAALILFVYNPLVILSDYKADDKLPPAEGRAYIIGGKSRFGWKMHRPGAVQTEWDDKRGRWGDRTYGWFTL